jgi:hypothetical protein
LELQAERALLFFELPLRAYLVSRVILSYSYGLHRATATFQSRAIFLAETGLEKADVSKAESFLEEKHMATISGALRGVQVYEFRPYWPSWSCAPRRKEWRDEQLLRSLIEGTHSVQVAARAACRSNQPELLPPEPSFDEMLVAAERESLLATVGARRDLVKEGGARLDAGKLQAVGHEATSHRPVFRRPVQPEPVSETGKPVRGAREAATTRDHVEEIVDYARRKMGQQWISTNRGLIVSLVANDRDPQHVREALSGTADFMRSGRKFRTTQTAYFLGYYHNLRPEAHRKELRTSAAPQEARR